MAARGLRAGRTSSMTKSILTFLILSSLCLSESKLGASIDVWSKLSNHSGVVRFINATIAVVNEYINDNKPFSCRALLNTATVNAKSGDLEIATLEGTSIAAGYPQRIAENDSYAKLRMLFKATPRRLRKNCDAMTMTGRRRRQTDIDDDQLQHLNKTLIAMALAGRNQTIEQSTGIRLISVEPSPDAVPTTPSPTITTSGVPSAAPDDLIPIIAGAAGGGAVVVIVVIVIILRRSQSSSEAPRVRSRDRGLVRAANYAHKRSSNNVRFYRPYNSHNLPYHNPVKAPSRHCSHPLHYGHSQNLTDRRHHPTVIFPAEPTRFHPGYYNNAYIRY